ncbi:MAG: hypothetical protein ACLPQS_04775 [Acidimicrobiales bacterium]
MSTTGADRWKSQLLALALHPHPLRAVTLETIRRRALGTYEWRAQIGAVDRPNYAYCVRQAAQLAKQMGLPRISVIEFGVAGGNGLVALERHALELSAAIGVEIEVYGFDTGRGLPAPTDYRDLPYHWKGGFFEMDVEALRGRLHHAKLILGDIQETLGSFIDVHDPAPIGAVMHDMDLYSSTATGLKLFDTEEKHRLPRIFTYFDDIIGDDVSLYNDYTGERLAIAEFNESHPTQKISQAYNLSCRATAPWHHQIYIVHDFAHSRYDDFVSRPLQQLPLSSP